MSVRLSLRAANPVWVCLEDAHSNLLVNGLILDAGTTTPVYTAASFRLFAGAEGLTAQVNGHPHPVALNSVPGGVSITPQHLGTLPAGTITPCA